MAMEEQHIKLLISRPSLGTRLVSVYLLTLIDTCTSVQFESREGTPGLQYTSASGEESWTTVTGKNLGDKDFATALKDSRGVMYRQREGAPGLKLRRGNTRKSVS